MKEQQQCQKCFERDSLLDNLEVVEACNYLSCKAKETYAMMRKCPQCKGTGKVIRAATWDECINFITELANSDKLTIKLPSGGILRVKGE